MRNLKITIALLACLLSFSASAQEPSHVEGELLVRLKPGVSRSHLEQSKRSIRRQPTQLRVKSRLSRAQNIYQYTFDAKSIDEKEMLDAIRQDPMVEVVQFNHQLELRSVVPNDPRFAQQWQYINDGQDDGKVGADIDADLAWEVTTGGLSCYGDTIVVCIIDGGFQIDHPDLKDNIWYNKAEIPNNGIDDDNNNYIDDYKGWNTATNDDDVEDGDDPYHGTSVAGIIGAVGNNGVGVAGVNWNVKMMLVSGGTGIESEVIRAYDYALQARKRYNETNGEEGAFVVATNSSWGSNEEFAHEAPLWCAMYDELGEVGILSAGATANEAYDVQIKGDLPTTCGSDYLIAVTNVNRLDELDEITAWGDSCIDMGAFGQETYTAAMTDIYEPFGGTSAATPHVAGAIALLYSAPSTSFMDLVKADPAAAALKMKDYILQGGDDNESLQGITLTGKRLNVNNSLDLMLNDCDECLQPVRILSQNVTNTEAEILWENYNNNIVGDTLRMRIVGEDTWTKIANPTSPLVLDDLVPCSFYEVQLMTVCTDGVSRYSRSLKFKTDGCCENPLKVEMSNKTEHSITMSWDSVLIAESYECRWRAKGDAEWTVSTTSLTQKTYSTLEPCTSYEFAIKTNCGSALDFSEIIEVRTKGCGACFDYEYCEPVQLNVAEEWIAKVELNTLVVESDGGLYGYQDFTERTTTSLCRGGNYTLSITPEFADYVYGDALKVFIDYNANGVFDSDEVVMWDNSFKSKKTKSISIPNDAVLGPTRMRVIMCSDEIEDACTTWDVYGESEDYCVTIVETAGVEDNTSEEQSFTFSPNPVESVLNMTLNVGCEKDNLVLELFDCMGKAVYTTRVAALGNSQDISVDMRNYLPGIYFIGLRNGLDMIEYQSIIKR